MEHQELSPDDRFIERMGLAHAEEGLPRISGRLMGLMLLEGGPLSFDQIAERLQVSRSSVSTNARILEGQGIIERTGIPGDRQVYYRLADDPYFGLLATVLRRKRQVKRIVEETLEELEDPDGERYRRLDAMLRFHELVTTKLEQILDSWQSELDAPEAS